MFRALMCSSSGGQNYIVQPLVSSHSVGGCPVLSQPVHRTATYRCDDTRGCVMQFWPPDDEHMCSKHVEAWNKLIVKRKSLCIKLVNYWDKCTETHGQQNVKMCDTKQAKQQKFWASSWSITEINILRCTVSKTSKKKLYLILLKYASDI